jgi:hippurate hydrolase
MRYVSLAAPIIYSFAGAVTAQTLDTLVTPQLSGLVETYKSIHSHPELSHHEERTAGILAAELRKAGYTVTERVGKYPDGSQAYGVVGILQNGPGPRLLIRADMDALPIVEQTEVPYASHLKAKNSAGQEVGVMHACGHDVHVTTLIGTARTLAASRARWHGTLVLIGQPSEETIDGAKAILADQFYERFGMPDFAIALHDTNELAAGTVALGAGAVQAGSTSIDVTLRGIGTHGAHPQSGKDPIVMAGEFIVQLQTIVSRQEDPSDPAVVTIGTIHGGTKRNIIPNEVKLEITARAFSERARHIIIDGIRRTAAGVALSAGVPDTLAPIVTVLDNESAPVLYNDPAMAAKVRAALTDALGTQNVLVSSPVMESEDFGNFGLEGHKIPTLMFGLGAVDGSKLAEAKAAGKSLPGPHSSLFQPVPEPTLRTGVTAMSTAAIALLQ